jgi:hypothetical protein
MIVSPGNSIISVGNMGKIVDVSPRNNTISSGNMKRNFTWISFGKMLKYRIKTEQNQNNGEIQENSRQWIVMFGCRWVHLGALTVKSPSWEKKFNDFVGKRAPSAPFENLLHPCHSKPKLKTFNVHPSAPKCTLAGVHL